MKVDLHELNFDGAILARGFWLYICEIIDSDARMFHYVGKTGDKASGASQSPFDRLSKHLGSNENSNALRRHLRDMGIDPEECRFRLHAYGPLFDSKFAKTHSELCDVTSGLEKALADAMAAVGYTIINTVNSRMPLDEKRFVDIRSAFTARFPKLASGIGAA